jgi:hypothetical protein
VNTREAPQRGQIWKHFKGGVYRIVEVGASAGIDGVLEGTIIVAYRRIASRRSEKRTWFRTLDNFLEMVGDVPRFAREECDR